MKALLKLSTLLSLFVFVACSHEQALKTAVKGEPFVVEARLQLQNKIEKKTFTLTSEAVVQEPGQLRLDLSGPFGKSIGRLYLNNEKVDLLVTQQKISYSGRSSEQSFSPIVPLAIDPRELLFLLSGKTSSAWMCSQDAEKNQQHCLAKKYGLTLDRKLPVSLRSTWKVEGEKFSLTFLPTNIQTNVQVKSDTFKALIPEGYAKQSLP